jgi:toxin CcdB
MARGDVCENRGRGRATAPYLLDLQADVLASLATRVAAPVLRARNVPRALARLHLPVVVDGEACLAAVHLLAAVPKAELGTVRTKLDTRYHEVMNAVDMLFAGI